METKLLTVSQVAQALGLSQRTVRGWILRKQINYLKVRGAVRITGDELMRIVSEGIRRAERRRREPVRIEAEDPAGALGLVRQELQDILNIGAGE